ncbi:MAG: SDR family oxidoreductase [Microthrixaceae bacterium]|nr:SDR family oxidoreductase [Microthrixaceae bacterium]
MASLAVVTPEQVLLHDKRALVTGAARGIGRATAEALAAFGARVALCDRLSDELDHTAESIAAVGCDPPTAVLDVRDGDAVGEFVGELGTHWGSLDILVNNAGGGFVAEALEVSRNGRQALIAENFTQVLDVTARCVPLMSGGGSVVNITSIEAHRAGPGFGIYSAMKAAVENLTRTLALELADRRIRVNAVAPDMIPTPGDEELAQQVGAMAAASEWEMTPWPDRGRPEDVAGAVVWLCSPMSSFVTGTTVHVDGGTSAASGWRRRVGASNWEL